MLEIGARPFAAVIEETDVCHRLPHRLDVARDELVEFGEIRDEVGRQLQNPRQFSQRSFLSLSRVPRKKLAAFD